ncbi:MAG: YceI family protein [Actinomycetota bacterium]|jgi:polyisoprenoid-binding protein YceI|nr:YceI family protein [Actinomycetota bacterium]PLS76515.1 MAG: YceI family protein [Actinomycetota bacterium]
MTPKSGTHTIGPQEGSLTVHTFRAGMGAKIGHDLVLEAKKWNGTVNIDADNPAASSVEVTVDLNSLEIVNATGGVKPLSDKDRADIAKNIEKTLDTGKHPNVTFKSTSVTGSAPTVSVTGDLTIKGTTRPATLDVTADGNRVTGKASVVQTEFGIKPFSAMMGALKVRDDINLEFTCTLPSA